ncbi:MAG: membrane protein insertase YidC [Chitinophagaceae bacterium]
MDRNTVIGFVLLAILLFFYLFLSNKGSQELAVATKRYNDSIAFVNSSKKVPLAAASIDSAAKIAASTDTAGLRKSLYGAEKLDTLENELLTAVFSNKGGQPKSIKLKTYRSYDSTQVELINSGDKFSYPVSLAPNQTAEISDLFFSTAAVVKNPDGSQSLTYKISGPSGQVLSHEFLLKKNDYAIDWNIGAQGVQQLFGLGNLNLRWQSKPTKLQKDVTYERQLTNIGFYEDNSFDYIFSKTEKRFEKPVQWVSISQQFFDRVLRAKNSFASGEVHWTKETSDSSTLLATVEANLQAKFPAGAASMLPLQLYFGPNDYSILKTQGPGMDRIVNLGRDMYAFVRPINVYMIKPVFDFFKKYIASYGIAILLLTLFIRLLTSPLLYKSYLSGAKMKVLRPEMDQLKKKLGDDQQAYGMEQMKLFREAGVNPLGGCIPGLLQIPIFFALYSFFNSNIDLRGKSFLWSHDLSAYDSILDLSFSIPFYGSHVSLFTLLAVATSFLISLYGMSNAPDQNNPTLKYMPYIFPVLLLGFFNKLPSALTWYYTVSNVITLLMQFVIQTYIINHDKILAKIDETRKKPKVKSKWQEKMEQIQQGQKGLPSKPSGK